MSLAETAALGVDGAFTSIPIIDLSKCGTPEGRLATAREVRDACMRVGFFYVQNHNIPEPSLDKAFAVVQKYFSLPMETKMKLYHRNTNYKGYNPPFDSNIDPPNSPQGDFHEGFEFGWEEIEPKEDDERRKHDGAMSGANVWPTKDYPEFREAVLEFYHASIHVGKMLFPLFALALELPETYFTDKTRHAAAIMRVLHYPLQDGYPELDDTPIGIGAHSDFECFTILWQQPEVQALQILNSEKRWIDATPIKDTLVVNIGDQLAMWTNDIFKSTIHRAINKSGRERYSMALFFGTDYDVNIEPIPSCVSAIRPAKYKPVTAGDYVSRRLKDTYPGM